MFVPGLGFTPEGAGRIYDDLKPALALFQPFAWPYLRLNYLLVNRTLTVDTFELDISEPTDRDRVAYGVDEPRLAQLEAQHREAMSTEEYGKRLRRYKRGYHTDDVPRRPLLVLNRMCFMQHGFSRRLELHHDGVQYELVQTVKGKLEPEDCYPLGQPVLTLQ